MNEALHAQTWMQTLREAGAPSLDAVGWHYIETLVRRMEAQSGPVQTLLCDKLHRALSDLQSRMDHLPPDADRPRPAPTPSPMARLLRDWPSAGDTAAPGAQARLPAESPRLRQLRQQLHTIGVRKQVSRAMAQAPRNAGPINSHMLVLRALGLMRSISPAYLDRFVAQVDTLLRLEDAEKVRQMPRKASNPRPPTGKGSARQR